MSAGEEHIQIETRTRETHRRRHTTAKWAQSPDCAEVGKIILSSDVGPEARVESNTIHLFLKVGYGLFLARSG